MTRARDLADLLNGGKTIASATISGDLTVANKIQHDGDTDSFIQFDGADSLNISTGGGEKILINNTGMTVNEDSADLDFRVESNGNTHTLFVEGGSDAVHFGKSAYGGAGVDGVTISAYAGNGQQFIKASTTTGASGSFNRNSTDGSIMDFRHDGTICGEIGQDAEAMYIGFHDCALIFQGFFDNAIIPYSPEITGIRDDVIDLGYGSARFDDIFATNTSITTSDQTEKQDIASLTTAEMTAAKAISKLFKTYKWKSKVAAKGDAARTHSGVIAQEVQAAMSAAGLDATKYAFWCSDTWWEATENVPAREATGLAPAKDAYTRIVQYQTADEAPEGATQRTRLGVRYPELLAFVGAATEQRLADIETRLTALENAG